MPLREHTRAAVLVRKVYGGGGVNEGKVVVEWGHERERRSDRENRQVRVAREGTVADRPCDACYIADEGMEPGGR